MHMCIYHPDDIERKVITFLKKYISAYSLMNCSGIILHKYNLYIGT